MCIRGYWSEMDKQNKTQAGKTTMHLFGGKLLLICHEAASALLTCHACTEVIYILKINVIV